MQTEIEKRVRELVAAGSPDLEVLLVEPVGRDTLRVFIDRPGGVGLEHCEQVTGLLGELREDFAIEVSSPGPERPLTRPEHFQRFSGRQAKLRLSVPVTEDQRRTVSGEIVDADEASVTLLTEDGRLDVSYESIGRANLVAA